jgi:uncharacterized membrane protein YebE (DUF533 family)
MKQLTISGHTCVETLAILVAMAWADGRLEASEKAGVRGAASVLNLRKELRERLDAVLENPVPIDQILYEEMSVRDRAFAYVAAAWMSGVDDDIDEREESLLDQLGTMLGLDAVRKAELETIARDLGENASSGERKWADELTRLFKAIPPRLEETLDADEIEVVLG